MAEDSNMDTSLTQGGEAYDQTISNTSEEAANTEPSFSGFYGWGEVQAGPAFTGGKEIAKFQGLANVTDFENRYKDASINQSGWSAVGNGLAQAVYGEILGGTVQGFGALGNWMVGSERNFLEDMGNHMMESAQEDYAIFERNRGMAFDMGDPAWWAKALPSFVSTVSMMIPGAAVSSATRGLSKVARGTAAMTKAAKASKKVAKGMQYAEEGLVTVAGAAAMRHAENMREAHGVADELRAEFHADLRPLNAYEGTEGWQAFVRDNGRKPINKGELADYVAGAGAKRAYAINSSNFAFDVIQMWGLQKALRGTRGAMRGVAGAEARAGAAAGSWTRGQRWGWRVTEGMKFAALDMGTEGVEEMVNFVGSEEGKYYGRILKGSENESAFSSRLDKYTADPHFWESGFLGAIGGAVFTGIGAATGKARGYFKGDDSQNKMMENMKNRQAQIDAAMQAAEMMASEDPLTREAGKALAQSEIFRIGATAALEGNADIAEQQLQAAMEQMELEGATPQEMEEHANTMREVFAQAEESVAQAKLMTSMLGLPADETRTLMSLMLENSGAKVHAQHLVDSYAKLTESIEGKEDMVAQLQRDALAKLEEKKATEAGLSPEENMQYNILKKAVGENTTAEGVLPAEEVEALRTEKAELMAKKDERSEEESARLQEIVEKLSDHEDASKGVEVDSRVKNEFDAQMNRQVLDARETWLMSDEGLALVKEATAKAEKQAAKQEEADFQEFLKTANQQELESQLGREPNEERKAAIQDRIDQIKTEGKNQANEERVERSKDIAIPAVANEQLRELLKNSEYLKLDAAGKYYVDSRTGKKYERATTHMNKGKETNIPDQWGIPSSNIGNSVDEFVRDFFNGSVRESSAYPHLPTEFQVELAEQLKAVEAQFVAAGEKVVAKDVVLFHDTNEAFDPEANGVAGTVDLLTVDKNGNFRIYDMKTVRNAVKSGKIVISGERILGEDGTTQGMMPGTERAIYGRKGSDLQGKHQKQLSLYRNMLMHQVGAEVVGLGIMPIDVMYTPTTSMSKEELGSLVTERADLLPIIPHEPLETVGSVSEPIQEHTTEENTDPTEASEQPAEEVEPSDVAPVADATLTTEDSVSFPLTNLVNYFATRLQVTSEPGRGKPYLVHGHEGPVYVANQEAARGYELLMRALTGDTTLPITFEITKTGNTVQSVNLWSRIKNNPAADLLDATDDKGNFTYRPGKGDSSTITVKIGGVAVGTLPTTAELMQAAHDRGQANLTKYAAKRFGTDTRIGTPNTNENLLMSEVSQEAHLANAVAMHELRAKLFEMRKANKGGDLSVAVNLTPGTNSFGQNAQGSLIYDTSGEVTPEQVGVDMSIRKHGIALQLPSSKDGKMQLEVAGSNGLTIVAPYQQGAERSGNVSRDGIARWNSGALFVPLEHQGEVLWVRVPGQTISQLNSATELIDNIVATLESGDDAAILNLQNILGSNVLTKTKEGDWAIYPDNITGKGSKGREPLSVLRSKGWTTDVRTIVPGMKFDIAASLSDKSDSSFANTDLNIQIGTLNYDNINDFVAKEIKLGYAPVVNKNGETLGWTHPLAPAYPFNDGTAGKKFSNENTAQTQLTVSASPVANGELAKQETKKVSGAAALDKLMEKDDQLRDAEGNVLDLKDILGIDNLDDLDQYSGGLFMEVAAAESSNNTERATKEDMDIAEKWWAENMPHVPFKRVKGIIKRNGRTGYGIFEAGAVEVSDLAVQGTEYHEAFHAVMEMFLSPERRAKVLAEAAKLTGKTDEVTNHERLAEDFREYMLTKGLSNRDKSVIRRFFSELMELITSLLNGGFAKTRLFQQINRGKFATKPSATTAKYATRNKLIMADIAEYDAKVQAELDQNLRTGIFAAIRLAQRGEGGPVFQEAYTRLKELMAMDAREVQQETGSSKAEAVTRKMIELALEGPMKAQAVQVLTHAPEEARPQLAQRFKDLFTTNKMEVVDFFTMRPEMQGYVNGLITQEFTAGTNTQQQYEETFEKMNPKDSLSQTVKSLIETTPVVSLELYRSSPHVASLLAAAKISMQEGNVDNAARAISAINMLVGKSATKTYFGLPQMMNVDRVFPFMSERLAHLATPQEMFEALHDMGQVYPEFALLAIRLMKEDAATQAQFFAAMRRGNTAELVLRRGKVELNAPFEGALFSHNRSAIEIAARDNGNNKGQTPAEFSTELAQMAAHAAIKSGEMTPEKFVKHATKALEKLGFSTVDAQAMGRVLEMNAGDAQFRDQLFRGIAAVAQAYASYANASEAQVDNAERKLNKQLQFLVSKFAKHDMGAVSTTFSNVEGSRIYAKQVPSFITEWFDQFIVNGRTSEQIEKDLRNDIFRDERMYATVYGKLLFPQGKDGRLDIKALHSIRTFRLGGIDGMGGVTYTNLSDAQWFEIQLQALANRTYINGTGVHFLPITTPSDAGNTYMVPAIKYNLASDHGIAKAKMHLRETIAAEFQELQQHSGRFSIAKVDEFMRKNLQREDAGAFYSVKDVTLTPQMLDAATEIAYDALSAEARAAMGTPAFKEAMETVIPETEENTETFADARLALAQQYAISSYLSNWSTSTALAGTASEFKKKAAGNTVDMQKRHKHIMSPGISNAGVTGRTHFRSVTMVESVLDLTKMAEYLPGAYKAVDVADAQSYVSPKFYRDILEEHGDLTPEMAAALDKVIAGQRLEASEVKLLRPYKPFYYARVFNENTGLFESQQIKNSIIPVIPGISTEFDKFGKWMNDNNIDQVQMNSAHKVGQTRKQVELRAEDGTFSGKKVAESEVYTLPMSGYRKQVNVTDHWHNDSTNKLASQLEKIVIAGARRKLGERGLEITNEFLSTLDSIYAEQMQKVVDRFTGKDGVLDINAVQDWMVGQLDDGKTPQYVIDLIREGMLTAPSVIGAMRSRLFTMMENEVNTVRVAGGTQVQVASQFYRTNANRLRGMRVEDGKVQAAEIAVSRDFLPKEYRNMSIEEIEAVAPEVLEAITLRIPSEAMNSGAVVKVVEFLPEGMDGVIVPDEFVTQMGSDFDVDKLFFQFREGNNSKQDKLFDLAVEVFKSPEMLAEIMAPQGFDTFATAAKKKQLRGEQQEQYIQNNPYSGITHGWLRSDNMAGVALKGQAANKNVILLDMIRYGWKWSQPQFKVRGNEVEVDGLKINEKTVRLHAEAVAAAMDGAKDPVYGKLGINNQNFGMFTELLLVTNGDMDFAVNIIQSKPMQMLSNGHIRIVQESQKSYNVVPLTPVGEKFIESIKEHASAGEQDLHSKTGTLSLAANGNLFEADGSSRGDFFLTAAIGTWKTRVSRDISAASSIFRSDKVNVAKGIEQQVMRDNMMSDSVNPGVVRLGKDEVSLKSPEVPVKGQMARMFKTTANLLSELGDAYLELKTERSMMKSGQGMTMQQFDMYKAAEAAATFTYQSEYHQMGQRDTKTAKVLPEDRGLWSLEMWIRHFRTDAEAMKNPDLALVLSKLLVSNNPYNVNGTFYDNITLVGVNDEGELRQVTEAMDRLENSSDIDMLDFVETMQGYEAQRSRYAMSQGRLTRILPTEVQRSIATAAGAAGVLDVARDVSSFDIIAMDAHNPNVTYLYAATVADAIVKAENLGKAQVYRTVDNQVLIPVDEDEKGNLSFVRIDSPNNGQKFSGKPVDRIIEEKRDRLTADSRQEEGYEGEDSVAFSKLGYSPEMGLEAKVEHLKNRFAKVGIKVNVKMDSTLPANGAVKIDKGTATVFIHPDKLQGDTVAHEFGHILVEALGIENELVKQAIDELKGSDLWNEVKRAYPELDATRLAKEVLVTAIGRKGTELFEDSKKQTKFRGILNRILRAIGKLFGITPKAVDQLAQELMFGEQELSLDAKLSAFEEQRRTESATKIAERATAQLKNRLKFLRQQGGTSAQAEKVLTETKEALKAVAKGTVANRISALNKVVDDAIGRAQIATDRVEAAAAKMGTTQNYTESEIAILQEAQSALDEMTGLLDMMQHVAFQNGEELKPHQKALNELYEKYDTANETLQQLKTMTKRAVSNKLVAQSSNKELLDNIGEDLIFDLFDNGPLRKMMTDVDSVTAGTLGVKEFRNPVVQNIVKLVQDTLETARQEGKSAEGRLAQLFDEYSDINLENIIDFEAGTFKTEYDPTYYIKRKEAEQKGMKALMEFDRENSVNQYNDEYYDGWLLKHAKYQKARSRYKHLLAGGRLGSEAFKAARKEYVELLQDAAEDFMTYHNVEVADEFYTKLEELEARNAELQERAMLGEVLTEEEQKELWYAKSNFLQENAAVKVGDKFVPIEGKYSTVEVKEEFNNSEFNAQEGSRPNETYRNSAYKAGSREAEFISKLQAEMLDAAGAHGRNFVMQGFIPAFKSVAGKSTKEKLQEDGKKAADAAKTLMDKGVAVEPTTTLVAADGGRVYIRNKRLFSIKGKGREQAISDLKASVEGKSSAEQAKVVRNHITQFAKDAHIEQAKRNLEPIAYLSREFFNESKIIDGQHVFSLGGNKTTEASKHVRGSQIAEALDNWYEGILGDNWENRSTIDELSGVLQRYTSLMGVGLNVQAWINNVAYGSLQRHLEMKAEGYFSKEQSKRAHGILTSVAGDIANDVWSGNKSEFKSVAQALIHTMDIADDQRELPFNMTEGFTDKLISKAFWGQTMGEIFMQNQVLFGMMLNTEVVDGAGNVTNLFEAYKLQDGQLVLDATKVKDQNGEWIELTTDKDKAAYMARFRNKVKSINHHIHGAYNKADAGTWQRHWAGRLALQFRRWLPMGIKKRLGKRMYNESRYREEIGDYRALLNMVRAIGFDIRQLKFMTGTLGQIEEVDALTYKNAKRGLQEIGIGIGMFLALSLLYMVAGLDDDDDMNFATALALNRMERLGQEMHTYTPWGFLDLFRQLTKDPLASFTKVEDLGSLLLYMVHDAGAVVFDYDIAEYEGGRNRGDSKLWRKAVGLMPLISHARRLRELSDNHRTYSLVHNYMTD
jgi:hypothetical protein